MALGAGVTFLHGDDGLAWKFQKRGHLRTFQDIRAWERPSWQPWGLRPRFGITGLAYSGGHSGRLGRQDGHFGRLGRETERAWRRFGRNVVLHRYMVERCFTNWQARSVSSCLNCDSFDSGDFGDYCLLKAGQRVSQVTRLCTCLGIAWTSNNGHVPMDL